MRIYQDCHALMSEISRDVMEMGVVTHSKTMQQLKVGDDPQYDTKEVINYSYCLQSLNKGGWLFKGDKDMAQWAEAELAERLTPFIVPSPGKAWQKRFDFWKPLVDAGNFGYTYNNRIQEYNSWEKLTQAIIHNPDSRQLILSVWDRQDVNNLNGGARVPCSIYYQFLLRDGLLHIIYAQRSADAYNHLGNDIWLAFRTMEKLVHDVNFYSSNSIKPGYLYHNIGSLHVYRKDWANMQDFINNY